MRDAAAVVFSGRAEGDEADEGLELPEPADLMGLFIPKRLPARVSRENETAAWRGDAGVGGGTAGVVARAPGDVKGVERLVWVVDVRLLDLSSSDDEASAKSSQESTAAVLSSAESLPVDVADRSFVRERSWRASSRVLDGGILLLVASCKIISS